MIWQSTTIHRITNQTTCIISRPITILKNFHDGARDIQLVGDALSQLNNCQIETTERGRHPVRLDLSEFHCNTDSMAHTAGCNLATATQSEFM